MLPSFFCLSVGESEPRHGALRRGKACAGSQERQIHTGAHRGSDSRMRFHLPNTSVLPRHFRHPLRHARRATPRGEAVRKILRVRKHIAACRGSDSRMDVPIPKHFRTLPHRLRRSSLPEGALRNVFPITSTASHTRRTDSRMGRHRKTPYSSQNTEFFSIGSFTPKNMTM